MNYKLIKNELEKPAPFQTTRTLTKVINTYNGLISNPFSNKKRKDLILYYWDLINQMILNLLSSTVYAESI